MGVNPVTKKDIDNTEIHLDDVKYYPKNFRRWRFRFNYYVHKNKDKHDEDAQLQKVPAWITYYRLNRHQK